MKTQHQSLEAATSRTSAEATGGPRTAMPPARRRIEDFGAHIPGARKDLFGTNILTDALDGELPKRLTEAWPAPPWEKIATEDADSTSPDELAFLRAVRDQLRTPSGWRGEHWRCRPGQPEGGLLEIAVQVMNGRITVREGLARIEAVTGKPTREEIEHRKTLYEVAGHGRDLGRLRCFRRRNEWEVGKPVSGRTGLYRQLVSGDSIAAVARKLPEVLDRIDKRDAERKGAGADRCPYAIRWKIEHHETTRRYGVWRRHAGRWVRVYECAERTKGKAIAEARDRIQNHRDELDAWFEAWRTLPEARNRNNEPRRPPADGGTDNPEEFTRRLGFRGVQFGNWVSATRRQTDLIDASQGLEDLATILGWPAGALSLGGKLGLAFGARGHGGPQRTRAHYEPGQRVIAISKPLGPGSLAHEWFHALDHEASRACGVNRNGYATESWPDADSRKTPAGRLAAAMHDYGCLLNRLELVARSRKLDQRRPKSKPYWATTRELAARAFEAWIRWRLEQVGIRNDYLVNIAPASRWNAEKERNLGNPYPTESELNTLDATLCKIADTGRGLVPEWMKRQEDDSAPSASGATAATRPPSAGRDRG